MVDVESFLGKIQTSASVVRDLAQEAGDGVREVRDGTNGAAKAVRAVGEGDLVAFVEGIVHLGLNSVNFTRRAGPEIVGAVAAVKAFSAALRTPKS